MLNILSRSASARAVRQLTPILACWGALGLLAGCASEPDSHIVTSLPPASPAPANSVTTTTTTTPPVVTTNPDSSTTTTTSAPVVSTTVTTQAPPAPQTDVVGPQPSSKYVWLTGYWTWRADQYQWIAGHWEQPPSPQSTWVSPRWEQEGAAFRFYEGYWN